MIEGKQYLALDELPEEVRSYLNDFNMDHDGKLDIKDLALVANRQMLLEQKFKSSKKTLLGLTAFMLISMCVTIGLCAVTFLMMKDTKLDQDGVLRANGASGELVKTGEATKYYGGRIDMSLPDEFFSGMKKLYLGTKDEEGGEVSHQLNVNGFSRMADRSLVVHTNVGPAYVGDEVSLSPELAEALAKHTHQSQRQLRFVVTIGVGLLITAGAEVACSVALTHVSYNEHEK